MNVLRINLIRFLNKYSLNSQSIGRTYKAQFRRRSTHVPNLTDELSTAKERRLNQFGTAVLVRCGKSVRFDRVSGTFVELNKIFLTS